FNKKVNFRYLNETDLMSLKEVSSFNPDIFDLNVIELTGKATNIGSIQEELELFIHVLRLFKIGAIAIKKYRINSESILGFFGEISYPLIQNLTLKHKLMFKNQEIKNFEKFYAAFKKLIPAPYSEPKTVENIALKRYEESLTRATFSIEKFTYAVMGLESLFLDDNRGITNNLSLRISKLLSILGENPLVIRDEIKEAYKLRSKHVHGQGLSDEQNKKCDLLLPKILNYLRTSILIFLLLKKTLTKKQLIKKIDNSLIDSKEFNSLSKIIIKKTKQVKFSLLNN
ncbi:MAG: hypothetical protein JW703_04535, partial [Candidatus Diapherotrites archaeon]|nr:hypothetical protein [Candidatus Diapherotrites archaeon]